VLRAVERGAVTYGVGGSFDLIALLKPPAWHADAACKEHPELTWFPEHGGDVCGPKTVCERCLVKSECLTAGLEENHGVWAGTSPRHRVRLRSAAA
jgi:WhiB family transcriptional regulator, redox-sensing transcriptional regulator